MATGMYVGTADSGVQQVEAMYVGTVGSGTQRVLAAYVGTVGSGVQMFFSGLVATASPSSLIATSPTNPVTSGATTVTPSNGIGPYTYAWTVFGTFTVTNPTSATTTMREVLSPGDSDSGTARCTVTDTATGATAFVDVPVILTRS